MSTTTQPIAADSLSRHGAGEPAISVTLLAPTLPARTISPTDRRALDELAATALDHLEGIVADEDLLVLRAQLAIAVEAAGVAGTDVGIAVTVSPGRAESVTLPVAPRRRVLIDTAAPPGGHPGWAWPRHRVVVLSGRRYRLFEGRRGVLAERSVTPAGGGPVPVRPGRRRRPRPDRWIVSEQKAAATVHDAAAALGFLDRARRLPVVVVGPARSVRLFTERTGHDHQVIGTVVGDRIDDPPAGLATLVAPVLDDWIDRGHARILATLEDAERSGRLHWGLGRAWQAALAGEVEQLWLADDCVPVTRLAESGTRVTFLDGHGRGDPDELFEELLELVAIGGGAASQVPVGVLDRAPAPAAVQVRARRETWGERPGDVARIG